MRADEEIKLLKEKLARLESLQRDCNHQWGKAEYDPEKKEIIESRSVYQGSDWWEEPVHTGRYETIDRWSRTCKKCGFKQYTYDTSVVEVKKKPKF